ncbi:MAG: glycoside hydrolase family 127 protein [Bryobacteraceae bacterium]|nr:glycoside hydrolase family 127 protein [Bryobacteraceae bacterium]
MLVRCFSVLAAAAVLCAQPPLSDEIIDTRLHLTGSLIGDPRSAEAVAQWALQRLRTTNNPAYADLLERALLNRALRGHLPMALASSGGHLYVNLYEDGAVDWPGGRIVQRTRYPFDGTVEIELQRSEPAAFTLHLRIPAWVSKAEVTVAGAELSAKPGTYASLSREWRAGERVKLTFDLTPRLLIAHPGLRQYAGRAAVAFGPLVYTLAPTSNTDPADLALASFNPVRPRRRPDGVVVLDHLGSQSIKPSRGQPLYQPFSRRATRRADLTLIPFALSSEPDPDAVWIPVE